MVRCLMPIIGATAVRRLGGAHYSAAAAREQNRILAWIGFAGCLVQIGLAVSFGLLIGNMFDFPPLTTAIIACVLAAFSLRSATQEPA
jgi:4-amino-4-deoxy-L-arabinose transferase-like glycosyltransferase